MPSTTKEPGNDSSPLDDYWARVFSQPSERPRVTSDQFRELFLETAARMNFAGRPYVVDQANDEAITLISQYFTSDPDYEKDGRNLKRGICLTGPVGTGKTFLFEVAHQVLLRVQSPLCLRLIHVNELEQGYSRDGNIIFDRFGRTFRQKIHGGTSDPTRPIAVVLDDMGSENGKASYFGTAVDVVVELIIERYKHFLYGMVTHATTNLNFLSLLDRYGQRAFDRMRQMMDFIKLEGKSRRA